MNLIHYVDHTEGTFGDITDMTVKLETADGREGRITFRYDDVQPAAIYDPPLKLTDVAGVHARLTEELEERDLEMYHDAFLDSDGEGSRDRVLTY